MKALSQPSQPSANPFERISHIVEGKPLVRMPGPF